MPIGLIVNIVLVGVILFCYELYFDRKIRKLKKLFKDVAKAWEFYDRNMYKAALVEFRRIAVQNKGDGFIYEGMGDCLFSLGQKAEALKSYEQAILLDKDSEFAFVGIGKIFLEDSNISEAINNFKKAILIDSKNPIAKYYLSLAYEKQGNDEAAIKELSEVLDDNPEVEFIYDKLYEIYTRLGRCKEAKAVEKWRKPRVIN